jgi:hypothetical protein
VATQVPANPYELQRAQIMQRNTAHLMKLGIPALVEANSAKRELKAPKPRRVQKPQRADDPAKWRRSERLAGITRPNYMEMAMGELPYESESEDEEELVPFPEELVDGAVAAGRATKEKAKVKSEYAQEDLAARLEEVAGEVGNEMLLPWPVEDGHMDEIQKRSALRKEVKVVNTGLGTTAEQAEQFTADELRMLELLANTFPGVGINFADKAKTHYVIDPLFVQLLLFAGTLDAAPEGLRFRAATAGRLWAQCELNGLEILWCVLASSNKGACTTFGDA